MKALRLSPLLLLAACAAASAPIEDRGYMSGGPNAVCDVQISFSSACCGINGRALEGVRATVGRAAGVTNAIEWSWGREGEKGICVKTATPAAADALYSAIIVQRYPTDNHATTTVTREGRHQRLD
jgi:hypothetical protein